MDPYNTSVVKTNLNVAVQDPRLLNNLNISSAKQDLVHVQNIIDQARIDAWLLGKNNSLVPYLPPNQNKTKKIELGISQAKKLLRKSLCTINLLEETHALLKENVNVMSSSEWKQRTIDMGLLKDEFNKSLLKFDEESIMTGLKLQLKTRQKKRTCQKRRKQRQIETNTLKLERRKRENARIDQWLADEKDVLQKQFDEEKFKLHADCILDDVTRKKTDAKKNLSIISALVKLRTVREQMAQQCGDKTSLEDRRAFGTVTEKLIRMWENALQKYNREEADLKAILERNADADSVARTNTIMDEWRSILFGDSSLTDAGSSVYWALTSAERDLETFVAIRRSWDTFLRGSGGTGIPLGWVVPPEHAPNPQWTQYIICGNE